jgi:hypothetical protein
MNNKKIYVILQEKKQGKMANTRKKHAVPHYESPHQLVLLGFESPFERTLNPKNRWVVLAHLIPWDEISNATSNR